jgi:hypothetical protein
MIYFTWFINQILVQIILLNFLISVISNSYQRVIDHEVLITYTSKAELNREFLIIQKALGRDDKIVTLIVSANTEDESLNSQWYKFTSSVKMMMRSTMASLQGNVTDSQDILGDKVEQMGEALTGESKR